MLSEIKKIEKKRRILNKKVIFYIDLRFSLWYNIPRKEVPVMDSIEDMQLDFLDLFGVMVNGTEVPAFDQSGRRWYRLSALFQALELQGVGDGSLSSKPGNLFPNGEFQKHKGIWYGSTEGLSQFANYLYRSQLWLTNDQDKETAQTRFLVITQWLSGVDDGGGTPDTEDGNGTAEQALENGMAHETNANAYPPPAETGNERIPSDDVEISKPVDMPTVKPTGIDMGLFERLYNNLLERVPYMASCLSIPSDASMAWKLFAVMAVGYLRGSEPIVRPQNDSDGVWGQDEYLHVSEAIRRSLLFGQ